MAKKKKEKKIEPEVIKFPQGPRIKVNPQQYANELLAGNKPIDDAILMVSKLAKKLIGKDQSIINPSYPFWNAVHNTLLNIKNPSRKKKIREKLGK